MNFAYKDVTWEVVGLNRAGVAPELTGTCTNAQRTWGMDARMYTAPSGFLTPVSQAGHDNILAREDWQGTYDGYIDEALGGMRSSSLVITQNGVQGSAGLEQLSASDKDLVDAYLAGMQSYLQSMKHKVYPDELVPPEVVPVSDAFRKIYGV